MSIEGLVEHVICLRSLLTLHFHRGFCGTCGTVLFNHVSEVSGTCGYHGFEPLLSVIGFVQGKPDEHWAMRTGCLVSGSPEMEKELFIKSKPQWVPKLLPEEKGFESMPS